MQYLKIFRLFSCLVCAIALIGCKGEKREAPPAYHPKGKVATGRVEKLFTTPLTPVLYELPSGALATWRDYAQHRPTLVLYSTHPLLTPIPDDRKKLARQLIESGSAAEIVRRARGLAADPTILPPETVSAAIDSGLFSALIVILPTRKNPEEIDLEELRSRMVTAGFLSEMEASSLTLKDGIVSGTSRGLPLRIVHPDRLPTIETPVILHVDLGYFKDMYINEVKTPAYDLLYQLASRLRDAGYSALAATLSFSNQEVGFSLESRFLIRDLAEILRKPQLLDGNTPASWTFRAQALYATAMFAETTARELTAQAVQANPSDAAAQHALALDLFGQGRPEEAFAALDKAVSLDRGYGLEYLTLAERATELGQAEKNLELLQKAAEAIPDNPFIRRKLAEQLIEKGRVREARPIIADLRKLDWSSALFPEIPPILKLMEEAASVDVVRPKASSAEPSPGGESANPALRMPAFNHNGMGQHPGR